MFMFRARGRAHFTCTRAHLHALDAPAHTSNYVMKYYAFNLFFMFSPQFRCGDLIVDEWAKESHGNE